MPRRRLILFSVIVAFLLLGYSTFRHIRGSGMQSAEEMKAALIKVIPIGTPVSHAAELLRGQGFEVQSMTDASFVEDGKVRDHLNYLYGNMSEGIGVQRRWQVSIVHDGTSVTEIGVSMSLVGP